MVWQGRVGDHSPYADCDDCLDVRLCYRTLVGLKPGNNSPLEFFRGH